MDKLQFTASIIQSVVSLAWPAALVICVWLFREQIKHLMPHLKMKYKDFDVSFRLNEAEKEALALPPPETPVEPPTPEEKSKFEQIAELSPRAAVLEARRDVEEAVNVLGRAAKLLTKPQSMTTTIRLLRNRGAIDKKTSALLDDLRVVGNLAAHETNTDFSKADAMRFRALADQAIDQLELAEVVVSSESETA